MQYYFALTNLKIAPLCSTEKQRAARVISIIHMSKTWTELATQQESPRKDSINVTRYTQASACGPASCKMSCAATSMNKKGLVIISSSRTCLSFLLSFPPSLVGFSRFVSAGGG